MELSAGCSDPWEHNTLLGCSEQQYYCKAAGTRMFWFPKVPFFLPFPDTWSNKAVL